jgi:hypothetical protein
VVKVSSYDRSFAKILETRRRAPSPGSDWSRKQTEPRKIGGDYVNVDLLPRGNYHHVLEHARGWFLDEAGNLERVPVEVHRIVGRCRPYKQGLWYLQYLFQFIGVDDRHLFGLSYPPEEW